MPQQLKFDRAEARRLRSEGFTLQEIGQRLGVSTVSIHKGLKQAVSPHHEFLRSLSPKEFADYKTFTKAGVAPEEARRAIRGEGF